MPDLLWQAQTVHLNSLSPRVGQIAAALDVPTSVAALVLRVMHTPTTPQVRRDRMLCRLRVMP